MSHMNITEKYYALQQNNKTKFEDRKMQGNMLTRHSSNISNISETGLYEEKLSDIAIESSNNTFGTLSNYKRLISSENSDISNLNNTPKIGDNILKAEMYSCKLNPVDEQKLIYILNKYSREFKEDVSSRSSLSNTKIFKSTVEEIFDNFHANIRDFECYKQRFQCILSKDDDVTSMNDFIKDIIRNIILKENTLNLALDKSVTSSNVNSSYDNIKSFNSNSSTYTISSTENSRSKSNCNLPENIKTIPSKLSGRNSSKKLKPTKVMSAMNLDKIRGNNLHKLPMEGSVSANIEIEKEIPVKSTYARRNLLLNHEDIIMCDVTTQKDTESDTSLIYKFCSYFCKMFRRSN